MIELKLIDGDLHVYEDSVLIMKTRGNPSKKDITPFSSLEEGIAWYEEFYPQTQEDLTESSDEKAI